MVYYASTKDISNLLRYAFYAVCLLLFYYIIESGSRGSFLAAVMGVGLVILFTGTSMASKLRLSAVGGLFVLLFLPSLLHNEDVAMFERLDELGAGNSREELIQNALIITADYPILGCGNHGYLQEKMNRGMDLHDSHNLLASVFVMSGLVGLCSICLFLYRLLVGAWRVRKLNILSLVLLLSMVFIAMKTGGVLTFMLMWYIYAVVAAINYNENPKVGPKDYLKHK